MHEFAAPPGRLMELNYPSLAIRCMWDDRIQLEPRSRYQVSLSPGQPRSCLSGPQAGRIHRGGYLRGKDGASCGSPGRSRPGSPVEIDIRPPEGFGHDRPIHAEEQPSLRGEPPAGRSSSRRRGSLSREVRGPDTNVRPGRIRSAPLSKVVRSRAMRTR